MSSKELSRAEVMGRVKTGNLRLGEASELLELSYRQAKRLWARYREGGAKALQHGNCGRESNRAYPAKMRAAVRPAPDWFKFPAMMQMTVSTPAVLGMLKRFTRPFNFVHVPLLFPSLYPQGKEPSNFSLIMPFSKHRDHWLDTKAFDTHSGKQYPISLLNPSGRTKRVEVKCYGNIMGAYREHPEAKFLGPDGKPCDSLTRGLLSRSHIVAIRHRYIGKETSRRWEQGDDLSLVDFRCAEYVDGKMKADAETRKRIVEIGIRKVSRETGINRETVALVANGKTVKSRTFRKVADFVAKGAK